MKILFIYLVPPPENQILRFQQGIGSISAVLKQAGHETSLLYLWEADEELLNQKIRAYGPDLVAVSMTSGFVKLATEVLRWIKKNYELPVVVGGIHPTIRPEETIAMEGVFAICIGEGEYPLLELCEALSTPGKDPSKIQNLWIKQNKIIHRNELRPLIKDLDSLPFPDREIFPYDKLINTLCEMEIMGSRGCPHLCSYCVNHSLIDLYKGKGPYVRFRSVDNIMKEIAELSKKYSGIGFFGFHDDTFTLKLSRIKEFAEKYPKVTKIPFWCNATANSINEEVASLLKKAGCYEVRLGVESGNDNIRMNVLNKKVKREDIVRAFSILKNEGIQTFAFNMVGLPHETVSSIKDTIEINRTIAPDHIFLSIFQPYPGTKLDTLCREKGWFKGNTVKSYFEKNYSLDQPSLSPKKLLYYHDIFHDLRRWPWAEPLIHLLHHIPVTRTKTLWNVFRWAYAKITESRKPVPEKK